MQTTNLDRMRSKDAQAREVGDEENQIYTQFTDNMEANIIQRAKQAEKKTKLIKEDYGRKNIDFPKGTER